jgi:putative endonuclease
MITKKRKTGDLGEALAAICLKNKGYIVLSRNYWKPYGEIDLVCSKREVIHFIEVKTVSCEIIQASDKDVSRVTADWNPAERVDSRKLRRLEKVIYAYMAEHKLDMEWQIDAALVYLDSANKRAKVEILERVH